MSNSLWQLSSEIIFLEHQIESILSDEEGDKDERLDAAFSRWLSATGSFDEKASAIANYVRQNMAIAEARKAESKRMADLARESSQRAERLKEYLRQEMLRLGKNKIETQDCKLSLRKNPGSVKLLVEVDQVPPEYMRVSSSPDLVEIKKAVKLDKIDWAEIKEGDYSLVLG